MKNLKLFIALLIFSPFLTKAQDSTRIFNHEIGFNTVSLVKQLISNNPSSTLTQLPYDLFYNLYYKDKFGFRAGLGLATTKTETSIQGQATPRNDNDINYSMRFGLSYNFVKSRRLTLNTFADFLIGRSEQKSVNTQTTVPQFGDPVSTITTTSDDLLKSTGAQVGIGVKYNIYRHLSLYIEVPVSIMLNKNTQTLTIADPNAETVTTTSTIKSTVTKISIPTTVYLVLRF